LKKKVSKVKVRPGSQNSDEKTPYAAGYDEQILRKKGTRSFSIDDQQEDMLNNDLDLSLAGIKTRNGQV